MYEKNCVLRKGHVRVAAILIVVSCSAGPTEKEGQTLDRSAPSDDINKSIEKQAFAATSDASTDSAPAPEVEAVMPENPAHISIRLPRVPEVLVTMLGGARYPYPYTVAAEDDQTVVTLYLPQGAEMSVRVTPAQQAGVNEFGEPVFEPSGQEVVTFTIAPEAKLGTNEMVFGSSHTTIRFAGGAQQPLTLGENFLQGPVTEEFVGGSSHQVLQGIFQAERDMACEVSVEGCDMAFSFSDSPPEARMAPFRVELKAGQRLGIYPVVDGLDFEYVKVTLTDPAALPLSESEE